MCSDGGQCAPSLKALGRRDWSNATHAAVILTGTLCWLQVDPRSAAQLAALQGVPGAGPFAFQPGAFQQAAGLQQHSPLWLPFSQHQPAASPLPAALSTLSAQSGGCRPAPYRAYPAADPGQGMQSMASSPDEGMRVAEGCLRLLAI